MQTTSPARGSIPWAAAASTSSQPWTGSPRFHAVDPAQSGNVVEHAARDDPFAHPLDAEGHALRHGQPRRLHADRVIVVVETVARHDVRERVEVGVGEAVEEEPDVVRQSRRRPDAGHVMRGVGIVGPRLRVDRPSHRDHAPLLDPGRGRASRLGRDEVQRPELVFGTPAPLVREARSVGLVVLGARRCPVLEAHRWLLSAASSGRAKHSDRRH